MTAKFRTDDAQGVLDYAQTMGVDVFNAKEKPIEITLVGPMPEQFVVSTLEGTMSAPAGAFVALGRHDDIYPIQADIFEATYDRTSIIGLANPEDIEQVLNRIGEDAAACITEED